MVAYILGAGASKHVGYPLAANMGGELLAWMRDFHTGRYRTTAELIFEHFGAAPNIEDVITQLQARTKELDTDKTEDRLLRTTFGNARGRLAEAMREWFREIHLKPAIAYGRFADHIIQAGDV